MTPTTTPDTDEEQRGSSQRGSSQRGSSNADRQARWREKQQATQAQALTDALRERDEARTAARTIAAEAVQKISFSYRTDVERAWIKRWPWLPEGEALRLARLRWPELYPDDPER